MFRNAKVGDRVISVAEGDGVIVGIFPESSYPISVHFSEHVDGENNQTHTLNGRRFGDDLHPSLFYADGYVPPVPGHEPERLPEFEFDEVILVKSCNVWIPRHFKEFNDSWHVICFSDGRSSKTANGESNIEFWAQFKKYED